MPISEEIRKKMSMSHIARRERLGYINSPEARKKISASKMGDKNPMFGLTGDKCPNWRGGITPINKIIRHSKEYILWRESVFKRDNYTCIWCGNKGRLNADHIKPFAHYPELRFAIDNGRTLCIDCHKTTDSYQNRWYHIAG